MQEDNNDAVDEDKEDNILMNKGPTNDTPDVI